MCGENSCPAITWPPPEGSPPRVRGKPALLSISPFSGRITPACAGKTISETLGRDAREDHPRVCGENSLFSSLFSGSKGSPPRVRGKPFARFSPPLFSRITPACAGKTISTACNFRKTKDHPRVCGENRYSDALARTLPGSPPRVRGKPRATRRRHTRRRITPACAGKTKKGGGLNGRCKDHPRVCGENRAKRKLRIRFLGSPPRVRGKLIYFREGQKQRGITPACAGKTSFVFLFRKSFKDHPRVCGENLLSPLPVLLSTGSPPRVRGKLMRIEL